MTQRVQQGGLQIDEDLWRLVNDDIAPGTGIDPVEFWQGFEEAIDELAPKNKALLVKRDELQSQLDSWYLSHREEEHDADAYQQFLKDIGYLLPEGPGFTITTQGVDQEIAEQAGPQLVVPVKNARFALNAANARWGSLYDALYGTDAISEDEGAEITKEYNPIRGEKVIAFGRQLLDQAAPLEVGSHGKVTSYKIVDSQLQATLTTGETSGLAAPEKCVGYQGEADQPSAILLKNNGLHIEIQIDASSQVGKTDKAGVKDLLIEAAVTTIMDCEDSIAAVDAEDKVEVYRNWLGLMNGSLEERFEKNGQTMVRRLHPDRTYKAMQEDETITLPGRSLLFIRNVGHLMISSAILDKEGNEIPEGIMDGFITAFAAMHDLNGNTTHKNSRSGSINIVKPKMHGPEEVAFAVTLFERIESVLQLKRNTLKIGIMDEERRTTVNLKECIRAAKDRVVFINTGFLDRTGDEIHTSMLAGPFVPKSVMKQQAWIKAYEDWNVDIGLECGLSGKAQIGKGMWAMPDEMAVMLEQKMGHPMSGANTAWVPSPNGAILHATHYHTVNVRARQQELMERPRASLADILTLPIMTNPEALSSAEIEAELDNNVQGILGYVVRWIDQGVGCSKVPDINNVALMEDRATLRISSQHIANWLEHGVCSRDQVMSSLKRMAKIVDEQNVDDPLYESMAPSYSGIAFTTACDLIFKGKEQPSGYTEPLLHAYRIAKKATQSAA